MSQGFLTHLKPGARGMRMLFNIWSPFRGAGIKVVHIAPDFSRLRVELRMKLLNRNYVGTHYGGSLFSMTDPFYMIMMIQRLGKGYVVWDKSASIRFRRPGKGTVHADFHLPDEEVERVRRIVEAEGRLEPTYTIEVKNAAGEVVAEVEKTLSIKRAEQRPAAKLPKAA
jgi:acyl-coenzyme A thioesterase PaaI-like protein